MTGSALFSVAHDAGVVRGLEYARIQQNPSELVRLMDPVLVGAIEGLTRADGWGRTDGRQMLFVPSSGLEPDDLRKLVYEGQVKQVGKDGAFVVPVGAESIQALMQASPQLFPGVDMTELKFAAQTAAQAQETSLNK